MEEIAKATLLEATQDGNDLSKIPAEDRKKIMDIAAAIDVNDSQAVIQYGVGAQSSISTFSDSILSEIRSKDSGYAGEIITNLMFKVKEVNVGSLESGKSFLSGIPLIGGMVDAVKRFIARYEKVSVELERIIEDLEKARMQLLKDITLLDTMYEKNLEYLKNLDLFIAAGKVKLAELREKTLPEMKAKLETSKDPMDAQRYNDMQQLVERFDKKLHDLKLSRMISIQTAPQIRLIQNNNQLLVEKIQSSILNTIPLWKNQIVIAISIFRQQKALKVQKEITETTNDLLSKNSEMLKMNSLETARESEKGIVEIDTLKKVNADLIQVIDDTLKIQQEGRAKRAAAETELLRMEGEIKAKLTAAK